MIVLFGLLTLWGVSGLITTHWRYKRVGMDDGTKMIGLVSVLCLIVGIYGLI